MYMYGWLFWCKCIRWILNFFNTSCWSSYKQSEARRLLLDIIVHIMTEILVLHPTYLSYDYDRRDYVSQSYSYNNAVNLIISQGWIEWWHTKQEWIHKVRYRNTRNSLQWINWAEDLQDWYNRREFRWMGDKKKQIGFPSVCCRQEMLNFMQYKE